ncbi:MAG: 6-carboxytetrahydropterin synthase [Pseudanabaenaceae cyanobacterium]|jgi:6-pyruvoyltetrahydropterin/6-carboxytetrahydropterin synthase
MAKCVIHRRAEFSASHRYWLPELSEAENIKNFGACTNFPGHGHNYVLYVGMEGEIDHTGMVLNLSDVKHTIAREVTSQLNFSFLNNTWAEFHQSLPTTENIARVIWHRLAPYLPLVSIQLYEHPELWAEYQGKDMQAFLSIKTHFAAAHRLALDSLTLEENTEIYGKCARVHGHGHNYHVEVTIAGEIDPRTGMMVDLVEFQRVVDEYVIEPMDHTFLNKDIAYFAEVVPTAENIAVYIQKVLTQPIRNIGASLHCVKLIESPNNSCEVYGPYQMSELEQSLEEVLHHPLQKC